jgi:hypothetical protein
MKKVFLSLLLTVGVLGPAQGATLEERVSALEKEVTALKAQVFPKTTPVASPAAVAPAPAGAPERRPEAPPSPAPVQVSPPAPGTPDASDTPATTAAQPNERTPPAQDAANLQPGASRTAAQDNAATRPSEYAGLVAVRLSDKIFRPKNLLMNIRNDDIFWDAAFTLSPSSRPVRSIKGELVFSDTTGEEKLHLAWTINARLKPGSTHVQKGMGIHCDPRDEVHQWLRRTALSDLHVGFHVEKVIYED